MSDELGTLKMEKAGDWFRLQMAGADKLDFHDDFLEVAEVIAADTQRAFATTISPEGQAWAPLKYRTGRPLYVTGRLFEGAMEAVLNPEVTARTMTIVVKDPSYAVYHQYGTSKMPARPFLGLSVEAVDLLVELVTDAKVRQLTGD